MPQLPWATLQTYITFFNNKNETYTLISDIDLTYRYRYHFGFNLEVVVQSTDISLIIDVLKQQWRLELAGKINNICMNDRRQD